MRSPLVDKSLPGQRFPDGENVSAGRMRAYHTANLFDHQSKTEAINAATPFDLGTMGEDFDPDDIVTRYPEGQQFEFSHKGTEYAGRIKNGELYCAPLTRARDLS